MALHKDKQYGNLEFFFFVCSEWIRISTRLLGIWNFIQNTTFHKRCHMTLRLNNEKNYFLNLIYEYISNNYSPTDKIRTEYEP